MRCVRQTKLKSIDNGVPIGSHTGASCAGAHHAEPAKLLRERTRAGNKSLLVTWFDQDPAGAVVDMHRRRTRTKRHDQQSRSKRFQRHVAKGLGQAGKQENVGGRVVLRQRRAALRARENRIGMRAPSFSATDRHRPRRTARQANASAPLQTREMPAARSFLMPAGRRKATPACVSSAPQAARSSALACRGEKAFGIDPASHHLDAFEALLRQRTATAESGHEGAIGRVVKVL